MKILHVIPSVASIRGGPSQAIIEMVQALRQARIKAEIATTNDNGTSLLFVPLNQRSIFQDVPIWFFARFSPKISAIREFAFSASFTHWLWQNIDQYDLLHIHAIFSYPSTIAMAIARLKKVPYIVRPLGQLCHWSLQQSRLKKQLYLGLIERENLNHARAIHFTAQAEYTEAQDLKLKAPGVIIPHGLTMTLQLANAHLQLRQWLHLPEDEPIVLFLSRLHPKKGLELLIQALTRLRDQRFTFVIAGSGEADYEAQLHRLISESGLGDRTHMVGFVEGQQKDLLLQGADLFALTSYSENFGIAVLESLAAGLPSIVTPGVALSEVLKQHNLGIVPELNEEAIATAIATSLNQPEMTKEMGDRARKFIFEHYTWEKIANQLINVYQEILGDRPSIK